MAKEKPDPAASRNGRRASAPNRRHAVRVDGVETRAKILSVAEWLFAKHGIDAVSTRDIMSAAGTNAAAIHYHFGSRENLVAELLQDRFTAVVTEQERYLGQLDQTGQLSIHDAVAAIVVPVANVYNRPGGRNSIRLLTDVAGHPNLTDDYRELDRIFVGRAAKALGRAAPHLSAADRVTWTVFSIGLAFLALGGRAMEPTIRRHLPEADVEPDVPDALIRFLSMTLVAGQYPPLRAPDAR